MIVNNQDVFNLFNTNGRRNDVINAIHTYLTIIKQLNNNGVTNWNSLPNSTMQVEFYEKALEMSPGIFVKHDPYDEFIKMVNKNKSVKEALSHRDTNWLTQHEKELKPLFARANNGVEDRARHYTSNLVKLGFATAKNRCITPAGNSLLESENLSRDELESLLPVDNVNIIYIRQLLKLRIFDSECDRYYSPFNLAILALMTRERITEIEFLEMVQGLDPSSNFENLSEYIANYKKGDYILRKWSLEIPSCIKSNQTLSKAVFLGHFRNRKSGNTQEVYWKYYNLLCIFKENQDYQSLDNLISFYFKNKSVLNKAFGGGKNIFSFRKNNPPYLNEFLSEYAEMFEANLNTYLYARFFYSKNIENTKEYQDTTKRIFKATGIINFKNGYVELKYRELLSHIFRKDILLNAISGSLRDEEMLYDSYWDYESEELSHFSSITPLTQILDINEYDVSNIIQEISNEFNGTPTEEISLITQNMRKREFRDFLEEVYPIETVSYILSLFSDRNNDKKIQDMVSTDASVPTIYEYIVGIAWYYFSGRKIDLLGSFNLTLSANFEPLLHAGGGKGDIVIQEETRVVLLEATLMNPSSQKRGEWEPVLRHSINLKTEEETQGRKRSVTTFFIADSFDYNSINIWKAVASVRLQSTTDKDKFTDNVVIMPINNKELSKLMHRSEEYDNIINEVKDSFEVDMSSFDTRWREKLISKIIY